MIDVSIYKSGKQHHEGVFLDFFCGDTRRCLWQMLWSILRLPDLAECLAVVQSLQGMAQSFEKHPGELLLKDFVQTIFMMIWKFDGSDSRQQ